MPEQFCNNRAYWEIDRAGMRWLSMGNSLISAGWILYNTIT